MRSSQKGIALEKTPSRTQQPEAENSQAKISAADTIKEEIERALEGKVGEGELQEITLRLTKIAVSEQFSGPMPHPRHLREYESIVPGAAERIIAMAERNLEHNITTERLSVEAEVKDQNLGMWLGAAIFAMLIFGAFASLFVTSNPFVPAMFLGTAAIGGVVAFIRGRNGA